MAEPKTGSGKKFSITIQVPDDVAARWPDRATAEKLVQEVYTAMGGEPAPESAPRTSSTATPPPARRSMAGIVIASLVAGVIGGYLGARLYFGPPAERPVATAPMQGEPVRPSSPAPAQIPPASPSATSASPSAPVGESPFSRPADLSSAPKPTAGVSGVFTVQVGAYRVRENAELLLLRLHQDGFQAQLVSSGALYVVQLGPFQTRKDAGQLVERLKAHRYDAVVVAGPPAGN